MSSNKEMFRQSCYRKHWGKQTDSLSPWRERARVRGIWIGDGENLYGPAYVLTIILDFRRVFLIKELAGYNEVCTRSVTSYRYVV
jgi:hypothetical protein